MNKKDKRKFTAAFKVKVGLEALKGQSTIAQLAKSYQRLKICSLPLIQQTTLSEIKHIQEDVYCSRT